MGTIENQIINKTVNTEWFFLTKRPDVPPLPVWYKIKLSALSNETKKIYSTGVPWACFWYGNDSEFYLHGYEYRLAIKKATKILYSKKSLRKHLMRLEQVCYNAQKSAEFFDNQQWKNFDNKQLLKVYKSIVDKYVLSYIYGFITWCTPVLQYEAKLIINSYSQALSRINISPRSSIGYHYCFQKAFFILRKGKEN